MMNFLALIPSFGIIAIAHLLHHGFTEATPTFMYMPKPKGTVKTIKTLNEDIIDCVNIYKQISFDNPLIKSSQLDLNLEQMKRDNYIPKIVQDWHIYGECPFQTVPILRSRRRQTSSFHSLPAIKNVAIKKHEYAMVSNKKGNYYGGSARFSVSNPRTEEGDFSLVQLWLVTDLGKPKSNSIEAGLIYDNLVYAAMQNNGYNGTGCYNLICPGFVQTSQTFAIGAPLPINSKLDNTILTEIQISVYKANQTGDWWLKVQNETIGYWPHDIFSNLGANVNQILWGGDVYSKPKPSRRGFHTTTQMGIGAFPRHYKIASHVRNLQVMKEPNKWKTPYHWSLKEIDLRRKGKALTGFVHEKTEKRAERTIKSKNLLPSNIHSDKIPKEKACSVHGNTPSDSNHFLKDFRTILTFIIEIIRLGGVVEKSSIPSFGRRKNAPKDSSEIQTIRPITAPAITLS
ncbi:uncharacterized protein LOC124928136 [Impatiens glandulifera]|uniref:uncharacterized protein LOC124928136 n=1 Tax=Impatiens glandulifera TaxID=253017 RepID=UPI001FB09F30|nr:uncharacterized protein LOC124928136 [Impatiens glandulifera]